MAIRCHYTSNTISPKPVKSRSHSNKSFESIFSGELWSAVRKDWTEEKRSKWLTKSALTLPLSSLIGWELQLTHPDNICWTVLDSAPLLSVSVNLGLVALIFPTFIIRIEHSRFFVDAGRPCPNFHSPPSPMHKYAIFITVIYRYII